MKIPSGMAEDINEKSKSSVCKIRYEQDEEPQPKEYACR